MRVSIKEAAWLRCGFVAGLLLTTSLANARAIDPENAPGAWAERVQILFDADARNVARKTVRVWDVQPEKHLEFTWEPDGTTGGLGIDHNNAVTGSGVLTWRVRGSASYDPKAVYSTYRGSLVDGRPNGDGRLEQRSGEVWQGMWRSGILEGLGFHIDAEGNRYEGSFRHGVANGQGTLRLATGAIFIGSFTNGLRDGSGTMRLPGGTTYLSHWRGGAEIGTLPPQALADARIGGLIRAAGVADKVQFTIAVDGRMNEQAPVQYQGIVQDDDVAIYPSDDEINGAWNGDGEISGDYIFTGVDWTDAPAFVTVNMATTDKSKVKLEGMDLKVDKSETYAKPMLSLESHIGCVGFRPTFSFKNHGWGDVKEAVIDFKWTSTDTDGTSEKSYQVEIGNFGNGIDVDMRPALIQAGVDVGKLEKERFRCKSADNLAACRGKLFNNLEFGDVASALEGEQFLSTTAKGTVKYKWTDAEGTYDQEEAFSVGINLAYIETPDEAAECGDGFPGSPVALRYQDIDLPTDKRDYTIPLEIRGNKNLASADARLKMFSAKSTIHRMHAEARFADGSTRSSKPITFFYFRPNPSSFESKSKPNACYLSPDLGTC